MFRRFFSIFKRKQALDKAAMDAEVKRMLKILYPPRDKSKPGWMTPLEERICRAREEISDDQFIAFCRFVRDKCHVRAIKSINDSLDWGNSLDDIFYIGGDFGYILAVKRLSEWVFLIDFGFLAGPTAGSGMAWLVEFDEFGAVSSAQPKSSWFS